MTQFSHMHRGGLRDSLVHPINCACGSIYYSKLNYRYVRARTYVCVCLRVCVHVRACVCVCYDCVYVHACVYYAQVSDICLFLTYTVPHKHFMAQSQGLTT